MGGLRLIQHKKEAYWFYSVLSRLYDSYVNPLFWTVSMREQALELAELGAPGLKIADIGAGTGFTTQGIVARAPDADVTMLDQSPHQLERARRKDALDRVPKVLGDAEQLPFPDDDLDRWISAGSIEYWPDPQRAMVEAYRVLKPGGLALMIGPLRPQHGLGRRLADLWMLFPEEREYREWMQRAGFTDLKSRMLPAPWESEPRGYAIAISGRKNAPGRSPLELGPKLEQRDEPMTPARAALFGLRFAGGSLAGAAFVPIGLALRARSRLRAIRR